MANDLTNILPKILSRGLLALREATVLPRLVNLDYSTEAAQKGTTIDVPISTAISATDVSPSNSYPTPDDTTPDVVQIQLNKWKKNTPFFLNDKELVEIDKNAHFLPLQMSEAVKGLATQVNSDIFSEIQTGVGNLVNPAGDTIAIADITEARKRLHIGGAPQTDRVFVTNYEAEADLLQLAAFSQYQTGGSATDSIQMRGEIGERYGFRFFADDNTPLHTGGTSLGVGTPKINGTFTVGARTIAIDGAGSSNTTLKAGDSFSIAGDDTHYVVTADNTASSGSHSAVSIAPGLKVAPSDNADVTFIDANAGSTGRVAIAFHRDAIAFATRPLLASTLDVQGGSSMMSMTDPETGLSLRLEIQRQYKQVSYEFDILYGVKVVRPELACKVFTSTS